VTERFALSRPADWSLRHAYCSPSDKNDADMSVPALMQINEAIVE
jgi:hypothetical protein